MQYRFHHGDAEARSYGWRGFLGPCIVLVTLVLSPYAQARVKANPEQGKSKDAGFALDVNGDWFLNGTKIHTGQALPAGGKVETKSPNERRNFITIALLNGTTITRSCDIPGSCTRPISLPETLRSRSSPGERVTEAVKGLFGRQPERYMSTMSRGGRDHLQEAVIKLGDGQADMSPLLKGLSKGVYRLRFQPISDDETSRESMTRVVFNWEPSNPAPAPVRGLRPGLYKVRLENDPATTEAWVLISGPAEYDKVSASFQEAVELTKQWDAEVKRSTARSFLRAYLEFLSKQKKK